MELLHAAVFLALPQIRLLVLICIGVKQLVLLGHRLVSLGLTPCGFLTMTPQENLPHLVLVLVNLMTIYFAWECARLIGSKTDSAMESTTINGTVLRMTPKPLTRRNPTVENPTKITGRIFAGRSFAMLGKTQLLRAAD